MITINPFDDIFSIDLSCAPSPKIKYPRAPQVGPRRKTILIKKTDKHIRHQIYHHFKYNPALKQKSPFGELLYVYEKSDRLIFKRVQYERANGKTTYTDKSIGVLKHKNQQFNFYIRIGNGKKWINTSNRASLMRMLFSGIIHNKKIYAKRICSVLTKFCKKFNGKIVFKEIFAIPSDIIRMCYPALNFLAKNNEVIESVGKPYCRYFRGKSTSKFIKSFRMDNRNYPRFYVPTFLEKKDLSRLISAQTLKYVMLEKGGATSLSYTDNTPKISEYMTEKECNDNVEKGKFKEIPFAEAALM